MNTGGNRAVKMHKFVPRDKIIVEIYWMLYVFNFCWPKSVKFMLSLKILESDYEILTVCTFFKKIQRTRPHCPQWLLQLWLGIHLCLEVKGDKLHFELLWTSATTNSTYKHFIRSHFFKSNSCLWYVLIESHCRPAFVNKECAFCIFFRCLWSYRSPPKSHLI